MCTNLCISTDGFKSEVKVRTIAELAKAAYNLFGEFNVFKNIDILNNLPGTMLTKSQFAQIIGRSRLYQNMPLQGKEGYTSVSFDGFTGKTGSEGLLQR